MIVLQASHLKKSYDGVEVLVDASVIIRAGDKVGLVGGNGAGKTTLLKLITGEEQPDGGTIAKRDGLQMGYVSQYVQPDADTTVYQFVAEAQKPLQLMEAKLRELEAKMADPNVYTNEQRFADITQAYERAAHQFEQAGGYAWQTNVRRVLAGLQFTAEMQPLPISTLSGGQRTRLALARLLVQQPDLLVLDEPTNYLDTDTLAWLEGYLKHDEGSLLVVSHDRYFLDEVTTQTIALEDGITRHYPGNYAAYVLQSQQEREQQAKLYEQQQEEIARLESFVQKNIARASTTKRAQSRRKMLERMERVERPRGDGPSVRVEFEPRRPSGRDVLQVSDLTIGYSHHIVAQHISFHLERGMRLAILGPNGAGKSTLLKTVVGLLPAHTGQIKWGQHVEVGYYDQEQSDLDDTKSVIDQVWDERLDLDETSIRKALAQFLFRGEDVVKPVSGLSGGERSRLNLCRLMLRQANVLVMDEPTNHLDIPSKEALEQALTDYSGTLLFVSHDRYFIDAIATHIAVLEPDGLVKYLGNYTDYREKVAENERIASIEQSVQNAKEHTRHPATADATTSQPSTRRRIRSSDVRKLQDEIEKWERTTAELEARLTAIGMEQSEAAARQDIDRIRALEEEREHVEKACHQALEKWEQASLQLEMLQSESD